MLAVIMCLESYYSSYVGICNILKGTSHGPINQTKPFLIESFNGSFYRSSRCKLELLFQPSAAFYLFLFFSGVIHNRIPLAYCLFYTKYLFCIE